MRSGFRLAVVGAGRAGMLHTVNAREWLPGAELVCIVDTDRETAVRAGRQLSVPAFTSLEETLAAVAVHGVVITTPTFTHASLVKLAASAGKHVFCEKPMALSTSECDEMAEAAAAAKVVLQIGFVRRFQPEFVEAKQRVQSGSIGTPMVLRSITRGPGLPPAWAHDLRRSNGMLAEVNSHDFDCVRWLAGSEIERVYAETANFKGARTGRDRTRFLR